MVSSPLGQKRYSTGYAGEPRQHLIEILEIVGFELTSGTMKFRYDRTANVPGFQKEIKYGFIIRDQVQNNFQSRMKMVLQYFCERW